MSQTSGNGFGLFKGVAPVHKCLTKRVQQVQNRITSNRRAVDLYEPPVGTSVGHRVLVTNSLTQPAPVSMYGEVVASMASDSQQTTLSQISAASFSESIASVGQRPGQFATVTNGGSLPSQTVPLDGDHLHTLCSKIADLHSKVMSQSPLFKQLQEVLLTVKQGESADELVAVRETIAAETRDELDKVARRYEEAQKVTVQEIRSFRDELLPLYTDLRDELRKLRSELDTTRLIMQAALDTRQLHSELFEQKVSNAILEIRNRLLELAGNSLSRSPGVASLRNVQVQPRPLLAATVLTGVPASSPIVFATPPSRKLQAALCNSVKSTRHRKRKSGSAACSLGVFVAVDENGITAGDYCSPRLKRTPKLTNHLRN